MTTAQNAASQVKDLHRMQTKPSAAASINFHKMHGLGNDFVIVRRSELEKVKDLSQLAKELANRKLGLGCDQAIFYEKHSSREYSMEIYNADGSQAEACGNATRCIASIAFELFGEQELTIKVMKRTIPCSATACGMIRANMGPVSFENSWMPPPEKLWHMAKTYKLNAREILCADVGNPHLVIFCDAKEEIASIGRQLSENAVFEHGVNVSFASIKSNDLELVVWERGTGFSLCCGSAACAAFAAACKLGFIQGSKGRVLFQLGNLEMELANNGEVIMQGPTTKVASGTYFLQQGLILVS